MLQPQRLPGHETADGNVVLARRLRKLVVEDMGQTIAWKETAWADDFRKLVKDVGGITAVERILSWLEANWRSLKVKILSARSFRERFNMLCEINARSQPEKTKHDSDVIYALKELRQEYLDWPGGEPEGYEEFVASVFEDAKRMVPLLMVLRDDKKADPDARYLARELLWELNGDSLSATVRWVRWTCNDVEGWSGWSGYLKNHAFKPGSHFFSKFIRLWGNGRTTSVGIKDFIEAVTLAWKGR